MDWALTSPFFSAIICRPGRPQRSTPLGSSQVREPALDMAEGHLIVAIEHHAGESLLSFGCFLAACSAGTRLQPKSLSTV